MRLRPFASLALTHLSATRSFSNTNTLQTRTIRATKPIFLHLNLQHRGGDGMSQYLPGPPSFSVVSPGNCQFNESWTACKLVKKQRCTADTVCGIC